MTPLFSHRLQVRFRDCDPLGHVNHAVYLTYLEQARFNLWRAIGIASPDGERVPGVILARAEIDYRRPASYGDILEIQLGLAGTGRTSFTYEYEILDAQRQLVASARTVLVRYDYATSKPVPLSDELKEILARTPNSV